VIDEETLKSLGAAGVVKRGKIVQVVMGTQSDRIAARIKPLLKVSNTEAVDDEKGS
jgi:PTS system N-acetylglucosamine-specific IIC component